MPIVEITLQEFNKRQPEPNPMTERIVEDRAWFASENGAVLGVLTFDKSDEDWRYVILGRDERGQLHGIAFGMSQPLKTAARKALLEAMTEINDSGVRTFSRN
jgi:hypothetical protein